MIQILWLGSWIRLQRHHLDFRLEDLFGIYFVGQNSHSRKCYISCRPKKHPLILKLPDKDDLKDIFIIGGNWECGLNARDRVSVPREGDLSKFFHPNSFILLIFRLLHHAY